MTLSLETAIRKVRQAREVYTTFVVAGKRYFWDLTDDGRLIAQPYAGSALEKAVGDIEWERTIERIRKRAAQLKVSSL